MVSGIQLQTKQGINFSLVDSDNDLSEVLLVLLELVSLRNLVEAKDSLVNDGLDSMGLDTAVHVDHLSAGSDVDSTDSTDTGQRLESRFVLPGSSDESDQGDGSLDLNSLVGLGKSGLSGCEEVSIYF